MLVSDRPGGSKLALAIYDTEPNLQMASRLLVGTPHLQACQSWSQKNLFHSLSVVLLYLLSIPCLYIPSLYPFFTQSLPVTHTLLTLPIYVHTLHSLSILLIYPPLYHPTLQPPDSPYFNPNTQGVLAPHLTKGGGTLCPPPLKSPKSNIFGHGKLGQAITNYYQAFGRKKIAKICTEKYF